MIDTTSIFPLTDFLRQHTVHIKRITSEKKPELFTINGTAAVVVMDHASWQTLVRDAEHARTVAAIRDGIAAADRGELVPAEDVFAEIRAEAGLPPRAARELKPKAARKGVGKAAPNSAGKHGK